jgi:hypothetical protein
MIGRATRIALYDTFTSTDCFEWECFCIARGKDFVITLW